MIKLMVSDMDGTLLNEKGKIPERFWDLEKKLGENNVKFCVASGRQYYNLLLLFAPIQDNTVFLAENGALLIYQGKTLWENPMDSKDLEEWIRISRNIEDVHLVYCGKQSAYIEKTTNQEFLQEVKKYYHHLEMVDSLLTIKDSMLKLAICDLKGSETNSYPHYKKFEKEYQVVVSGGIWLDLMDKNTNKGNALEHLKELWNIEGDELFIFGDYLNDYEMFSCGEYTFAMENAHPLLKEKASKIIPSNQEEGVLQVMQEFLEKR